MKYFAAIFFVAGLVAAQSSSAAAGAQSTLTIIAEGGGSPQTSGSSSGSAAAAAATGISTSNAMVLTGQGKDLAGDSCGCQCLCGMSPPPKNAAVNNFGGFPGIMSV